MLIVAARMEQLVFSQLMDVYWEGNAENARDLYPCLSLNEGQFRAEQNFYQYLRQSFFRTPGGAYLIWADQERYVSALRMEPYQDGLLLEALETAPGCRRRGYGEQLLRAALDWAGEQKVYSHVRRNNAASMALHRKCGFQTLLDYAVYIDGSVDRRADTLIYNG